MIRGKSKISDQAAGPHL